MQPLFDAHFHILDPRFPLVANHGYLPEPFTCRDYLKRMEKYQLVGGCIVSGSFQAFDQSYLLDALDRLGPGFVGVTNLPNSATDQEIIDLNNAGVRAIRFNLYRGGSETVEHLERMANRVYDIAGWHTEIYIDSTQLDSLFSLLSRLPAICIDHLGLSRAGFSTLLKLTENGAHVKASAFGRCDLDVRSTLTSIYAVNPDSLMFGTDLPSTRAPIVYRDEDFKLVTETLGAEIADKVFYENALRYYRPKSV